MLAELKTQVAAFDQNPLLRGRDIRELFEQSPADFCTAAVEILSAAAPERAQRYLVALLLANDLLIGCLRDCSTPLEKAEQIAAVARRVDPQLPAKLIRFMLKSGDADPLDGLERVLELLKSMPDAGSLRPLLTPLLHHSNPRVRSKVALFTGDGNRNRPWLERRLREEDARVRANIVEAAGPGASEDLRPIFRAAVLDSNNRVAGNALVALYRFGETEAIAGLQSMALRPEPAFRATAAWAMGATGDTRFRPLLARMLGDPERAVKSVALQAVQKLRKRERVEAALPEAFQVHVVGQPEVAGTTLRMSFLANRERQPCRGISPVDVRLSINGEYADRYSIVEQECHRPIAGAILIPHPEELAAGRLPHLRQALEQCLAQQSPGDTLLVFRFSRHGLDPGFSETLFGVPMDVPEISCQHRVANTGDLQTIIECGASVRSPKFGEAFRLACAALRLPRASSHLFLVHPEVPPDFDFAPLAQAAKAALVAVHGLTDSSDPRVQSLCEATGGRYWATLLAPGLPILHRAIRHCYLATAEAEGSVRSAKAAVWTPDGWGSSPSVEIGNS